MRERHIIDSERVGAFLRKDERIIDIGSGAGFPGMVLAIRGFENVVLCEKDVKKVAFLKTVREKLNIKVGIFCGDVYGFTDKGYTSVSRAFGSLAKLLGVMLAIKSPSGFFHKGKNYEKEIKEAQKRYNFDYLVNKEEAGSEGVIISVTKVEENV
jgi:16S rRNA (guanine527-N7)-methyltransferase